LQLLFPGIAAHTNKVMSFSYSTDCREARFLMSLEKMFTTLYGTAGVKPPHGIIESVQPAALLIGTLGTWRLCLCTN